MSEIDEKDKKKIKKFFSEPAVKNCNELCNELSSIN